MHAVSFQVEFVPGREAQQEAELDILATMLKSTPGFVHGTWFGTETRGQSCLVFESEAAARALADNAKMPPDSSVIMRSVDVYAVARDI